MSEDPPLTVENVVLELVFIFTRFDPRAFVLLFLLLALISLVALIWVSYKGINGLIRDWRRNRGKP